MRPRSRSPHDPVNRVPDPEELTSLQSAPTFTFTRDEGDPDGLRAVLSDTVSKAASTVSIAETTKNGYAQCDRSVPTKFVVEDLEKILAAAKSTHQSAEASLAALHGDTPPQR